ncbi:unnamed protein product [Darwinula stevensoni]|uniref:CUB domain-containing protein n=1 Tax=Darwinula stevensoni TaxID=69355 RepID=A0A7R9FSL3_9CRUS|nr:unnamed protein product [Darwinula stevensoni]CAG0903703.1 unnamed protein product [Darwinula stevensoni]
MENRAHIATLLLLVCSQWSSVDGQCGGTFTEPTGSFESPNYPDNYNDSITCEYRIDVGSEYWVELTFVDFDLEWSYDFPCPLDNVLIVRYGSEGTEMYSGHLGTVGPIHEPGGQLDVIFKTDGSINSRGFLAEYRSYQSGCDEGWLEYERACYFFMDEPKTPLEAQRECEELEADLVSIHSDGEKNFIDAFFADGSAHIRVDRRAGSDSPGSSELPRACMRSMLRTAPAKIPDFETIGSDSV